MSLQVIERPKTFSEVIGNEATIQSLQQVLQKKDHPHCFMFHGISGSGKTTCIRIMAKMLGANELDIHEYNVADTKGIDTAREIIEKTQMAPLGKATAIILDECFPARTLVYTENGKKSIADIYRDKYTGKVLSYNTDTKKYEYKKVVNWIKKRTENDLIVFKGHHYKLKMTPNHKIYTKEFVLKQAKDFRIGDSMVTLDKDYVFRGVAPLLSEIQKQILFGMLLGDASISKTKHYARMRITNGEKQKEYLKYKRSLFSNMINTDTQYVKEKSGYCDNNVYYINTYANEDFLEFRNMFYPDDIKIIPDDMSLFTWVSMAFLIMDDGSYHKKTEAYTLSSHAFSKKQNEQFLDFLTRKYGITGTIICDKRKNLYYISFHKKSTDLIASHINIYMHKNMEYKLPDKYKLESYDFTADKINYGTMQIRDIYYEKPESPWVYNIEVEDNHNYFVNSGFLVGNCHKATGNFQEALLKPTEDVPSHVYFFLATTEPNKIIPTLRRRFTQYQFLPIDDTELFVYLFKVAKKHDITISKEVIQMIVDMSHGSVAQGLNILNKMQGVTEEDQIELLNTVSEKDSTIIELCRALLYNSTWSSIIPLLANLQKDPDSIRYTVLSYMNSVLMNPKSGKIHMKAAKIIDTFSQPLYTQAEITCACFTSVL
jgi:DNA polymerase III gamma/tau subunit